MNDMKTHYNYVHFTFPWGWIKDKEIQLEGNHIRGMLYILDKDGRLVKVYGYELVSEE